MPAVSIVIPYYKHPQFLEAALESIYRQTLPDWEIIVVDDASPDGSSADLRKKWNDPRLRWIEHTTNRGPGAARNSGAHAARAEWIFMLDSDDRLHPHCLETLTHIMRNHPEIDCAFCDFEYFGAEERVHRFETGPLERLAVTQWLPAQVIMKRTLWSRVGGYSENRVLIGNEDWDFWLAAAEQGFSWVHIREVLYYYRRHPQNISLAMPSYDHRGRQMLYQRHRSFIQKHGNPSHFLAEGYLRSARFSLEQRRRMRALGLGLLGWLHEPGEPHLHGLIRKAVKSLLLPSSL